MEMFRVERAFEGSVGFRDAVQVKGTCKASTGSAFLAFVVTSLGIKLPERPLSPIWIGVSTANLEHCPAALGNCSQFV